MTKTTAAQQDKLFQDLSGDPAGVRRLANNYDHVAGQLERSMKRLKEAASDLDELKGKNFRTLNAHVGRLLDQYTHAAQHFRQVAEELRGYATKLHTAQTAAGSSQTRYAHSIASLNEAFSGSTMPAPSELMSAATYPDAPVDTTGWPAAALPVAAALDAARVDWHQAAQIKNRAGTNAHDQIDTSALLHTLGTKAGAAGHTSDVAGLAGTAAVAGGAHAVAAVVKQGSKKQRREAARKAYAARTTEVKKQYASSREKLTAQLAAAKKAGNTSLAERTQARLTLLDDREKYQLSMAKEHLHDRLDRINGDWNAKEERAEARADTKEHKELINREYQLDKADAQEKLEQAKASGDQDAVDRAQERVQLVEDRHDLNTSIAEAHEKSHLAHIQLHEHPGDHPAKAAHELLQQDKQEVRNQFAERQELAQRDFKLREADVEARLDAAKAAGNDELVHELQEHRSELQQAHAERVAELKQNLNERLDKLQSNYESTYAHPHEAAAKAAGHGEAHLAVGVEHARQGEAHLAEGKVQGAASVFKGSKAGWAVDELKPAAAERAWAVADDETKA
ncbi:coiled-coil domain-containing protein [Gryllotalpicola ginsengisoli]|uniref:hypothetical protein n=1 Tax=Gryllotalpicola ginsengisoli TaxID=444608 RepID=UPI0003B6815B|nr:hypothetical protein [Gryllotalpicola ginsengisoli]